MSEPITIVLPLPSRDVSPNSRGHWAKKARAVKQQRRDAFIAATLALYPADERQRRKPRWKSASAKAVFYFRDARRRDRDNMAASLKGIYDGIVDAGILADDSGLTHEPIVFEVDKENPRVVISIRPLTGVLGPAP